MSFQILEYTTLFQVFKYTSVARRGAKVLIRRAAYIIKVALALIFKYFERPPSDARPCPPFCSAATILFGESPHHMLIRIGTERNRCIKKVPKGASFPMKAGPVKEFLCFHVIYIGDDISNVYIVKKCRERGGS